MLGENTYCRGKNRWRIILNDLNLTGFDEDPVRGFTREVLHALHRAIILAVPFEELDANPFPGRERSRAIESDDTSTN